jgi:hypothetical protein
MGPGNPFAVDEDKALAALGLAWGDLYEVWILDGKWCASRNDVLDSPELTADTPDALNRLIRDDWAGRALHVSWGVVIRLGA